MEILEELKEIHPNLKYEYDDGLIYVSGIQGNTSTQLIIDPDDSDEEGDLNNFKVLPLSEMILLQDINGFYFDKTLEISLDVSQVRKRMQTKHRLRQPLEIKINYNSTPLEISISRIDGTMVDNFNKLVGGQRGRFVLTIKNFEYRNTDAFVTELRDLINCIIFDVNYNLDVLFEPISVESKRRIGVKINRKNIPPMTLTYKKYQPELIEYFRIAHQMDYLPFKYLCYFHIIEYFMDKSAFLSASQKIKEMILKPDFHLNMDKYVGDALNILKKESDRHQTDLNKIERVLVQFLEKDEIFTFLEENSLLGTFNLTTTITCGDKQLKLPPLKKEDKKDEFMRNLSKRIYSLRCSIVHSNPDFDEKKAIPFVANRTNLEKLQTEIILIEETAKTIILKTSL